MRMESPCATSREWADLLYSGQVVDNPSLDGWSIVWMSGVAGVRVQAGGRFEKKMELRLQ